MVLRTVILHYFNYVHILQVIFLHGQKIIFLGMKFLPVCVRDFFKHEVKKNPSVCGSDKIFGYIPKFVVNLC